MKRDNLTFVTKSELDLNKKLLVFLKKYTKKIFFLVFFTICFSLCFINTSCVQQDSDIEWGNTKIFIPQAFGVTYYAVPTGSNYSIDSINGKIIIPLGVSRSGTQKYETFSVDLSVNNDTINSLITSGSLTNIILLPSGTYIIPKKVTIDSGNRDHTFYLSLDKASLSALTGQKLAVAVNISNPSKYEINKSLSTIIVVIDLTKIP
ncbi:MAG: DUF1735 domain-containing protein [Paludibacter sp.]|nr:DUF1735 domain-containing protein [Paludibacter sp.]